MKLADLIKQSALVASVDNGINDFDKLAKVRVWVEGKSEAVDFDIKAVYYDDIGDCFVLDTVGRMGADGRLINNGWRKIT